MDFRSDNSFSSNIKILGAIYINPLIRQKISFNKLIEITPGIRFLELNRPIKHLNHFR